MRPPYLRQASNNRAVLVLALHADTFQNGGIIEGFVELTTTDHETMSSIFVELVERHKDAQQPQVWDRMMVAQGPFQAAKNDTTTMPFSLHLPEATATSGPSCSWEIRGQFDPSGGVDLQVTCPISIRNVDLERVCDAFGAFGHRVVQLEPAPLGQRFVGTLKAPEQLTMERGIAVIGFQVEVLDAASNAPASTPMNAPVNAQMNAPMNTAMRISLAVEKNGFFGSDQRHDFVFQLSQLRTAPLDQISQYFQHEMSVLLARCQG